MESPSASPEASPAATLDAIARKHCLKLLDKLTKMDPVGLFEEPVSTVDFPDYPNYVTRPMCFRNIRVCASHHRPLCPITIIFFMSL